MLYYYDDIIRQHFLDAPKVVGIWRIHSLRLLLWTPLDPTLNLTEDVSYRYAKTMKDSNTATFEEFCGFEKHWCQDSGLSRSPRIGTKIRYCQTLKRPILYDLH